MRTTLRILVVIFSVLLFHLQIYAQSQWVKYANNPVLEVGQPGSWDAVEVAHPAVLYIDSMYKMWFVGNDGTNVRIGYATSPDGINWTKYANNPVLDVGEPGDWDEHWVNGPDVLYVNGMYHLWYTGRMAAGFQNSSTGYATSPDGINWTKHPANPLLIPGVQGEWDSYYAGTGSVLYDSTQFWMWYSGVKNPNFSEGATGLAHSPDGVNWTKYANNPVLTPGAPNEWDSYFVYGTHVLIDDGTFHMWYHGLPFPFRIGYATSPDGITWQKHPDNPVITPGATGEWDSQNVINPFVMKEGNQFKMWYTGSDGSKTGIGYATSTPHQTQLTFTKVTTGDVASDGGYSQGSSWADFDGDGDEDLVITNGSINNAINVNFFYRNDGNGVLTRLNDGVLDILEGSFATVAFGDYDNDGDLDVFVPANGTDPQADNSNRLYNNDGLGNFTLVISDAISNDRGDSIGSSWVDIDSDGDLDLFVSNNNDQMNYLYRNNGPDSSYSFTKITTGSIVTDENNSLSGAWSDYDNDGDLDLLISNALQNDRLYINIGNGEFVLLNGDPVVNQAEFSISGTFGDYDNDGDSDLFSPIFGGPDHLYMNNADGSFQEIVSGPFGNNTGQTGPGIWGDFDNDGDLDIFLCNTSGNNFFYRNDGGDVFTSVIAGDITNDNGYTCSANDFDMDGDLDILIVRGGFLPPVFDNNIYINEGNSNNWIKIRCEGTISNRSAIGAKVYVKAQIDGSSIWQMREIAQQTGYCTNNGFIQHFGLGTATIIDSLKVVWPSGMSQVSENLAVNQQLTIVEDSVVTNISEASGILPQKITLSQNYPNPFNPTTTIAYTLPQTADVRLTVYNTLGQAVRTLVQEQQSAGEWSAVWDGRDDAGQVVSTGVYIYRLHAGTQVLSRKMLFIR